MLSHFYALAERELTRDDAFLDFIGDQVLALYPADFPSLGDRTPEIMLDAAIRLIEHAKADERILDIGIGINFGLAQVGQIAMGQGKDFTAVGDVVNTAARLQAKAGPNEILISGHMHGHLTGHALRADARHLDLKGKAGKVTAYAVSV